MWKRILRQTIKSSYILHNMASFSVQRLVLNFNGLYWTAPYNLWRLGLNLNGSCWTVTYNFQRPVLPAHSSLHQLVLTGHTSLWRLILNGTIKPSKTRSKGYIMYITIIIWCTCIHVYFFNAFKLIQMNKWTS